MFISMFDQGDILDGLNEQQRRAATHEAGPLLLIAVLVAGVYGGYFGAAQGILLIALLSIGLDESLQRVNAVKNLLAGLANLVSGIIFAFAAPHLDWAVAGLLAAASISGGVIGARYGRRLPPPALRAMVQEDYRKAPKNVRALFLLGHLRCGGCT